MTGRTQTKAELIDELSSRAGTTRAQAEAFLDGLIDIARRDAPREFTIPGRCRIDFIRRGAARDGRSRSGECMQAAETDTVCVRPIGRVRRVSSTWTRGYAGRLNSRGVREPDSPSMREMLSYISFSCPNCDQEIEAPADMAGNYSECSFCAVPIKVPCASDMAF